MRAELGGELEPWVIHDLRRTCASGLGRLKVPPHVIEAALNHAGGVLSGVAGTYNRFDYADEKRAALAAWADSVLTIAGELATPACSVIPILG